MKICPKCGYTQPEKPYIQCEHPNHYNKKPHVKLTPEIAKFLSEHDMRLRIFLENKTIPYILQRVNENGDCFI